MTAQRPDSCRECSLYKTGRGFVLDVGDPATARLAICLETPASEELGFSVMPPPSGYGARQVLGTVKEAQAEALRRSAAFPNVPAHLRSRGVPVVGRTGALLNRLLRAAGIVRESCFIMNTLRCWPAKSAKGDNFPTGNEKGIAQHTCRQYDRIGTGPGQFSPDIIVVTMHPAALFKDGASSAEPLILADLEKAASFARDGYRVLVLMGGHAAETFLGYATNVSKWRGHYEWCKTGWYDSRIVKLQHKAEKARRASMPKEAKVKKPTKAQLARRELASEILNILLKAGVAIIATSEDGRHYVEARDMIVSVLTPPPKVNKAKAAETEAKLP